MMKSVMRLALDNRPAEWEVVPEELYGNHYLLFSVTPDSSEYEEIRSLFNGSRFQVDSIKRMQNPFQYGRYLLQKLKLNVDEEIVYHAVRKIDLATALQSTCEYRRYTRPFFDDIRQNTRDPCFYETFNSLLLSISTLEVVHPDELCVLVLNKLKSTSSMAKNDYVINYVVKFNNM